MLVVLKRLLCHGKKNQIEYLLYVHSYMYMNDKPMCVPSTGILKKESEHLHARGILISSRNHPMNIPLLFRDLTACHTCTMIMTLTLNEIHDSIGITL